MQYFKTCLFLSFLFATSTAFALDNAGIEESVIKTDQSAPVNMKTSILDLSSENHHPLDATKKDKKIIDSGSAKNVLQLELEILRSQNQLMKEYHSSLLDTVYWSLSAIITIAALLVGFGWWSNFRMHEKDKERLKDEIKSIIVEMESKVYMSLADNRTEYLRLLDNRLENLAGKFFNENTGYKS